MGSKSRIAKYIVPIIQSYIDKNDTDKYYEPFVGGANVIDKIKSSQKYGSDLNGYLIALLQHVQNGGKLYDTVSKELYDRAKKAYKLGDTTQFEDWQIGNIGFLASFNGKWFDGGYAKSGYEKTKSGERFRDYYREASDNLRSQSLNLKGISFRQCDYRRVNPNGFVIYCDPPYANTTKYANSAKFDYDEFWMIMKKWSENNIVIVSEENAPSDWKCIWKQEICRSLNASSKSKSTEKLFVLNKS